MASLNKVLLIGNLGRDPETRYLPSGGAVCNFSIATTDRYKDKQGQQQEKKPNGTTSPCTTAWLRSPAST